jgi:TPR repeat protein
MDTDAERHRALLRMHDRAYYVVVEILRNAGIRLPEEGSRGYEWAVAEAQRGNSKAQFCVAKFSSAGLFTSQDTELAMRMCSAAAIQQFPPALSLLAGGILSGWSQEVRDYSKVSELLHEAARLGDVGALHSLASLHLSGGIASANIEDGKRYLRAAAEAGDGVSQFELGLLLVDADDPSQEIEGLRWLQTSAHNGISSAHRKLGNFYRFGEHGLPLDAEMATSHDSEAEKLESRYC